MAKVGDNIVTTGLSGKLGNLIVFRNRGGHTYVSKTPKRQEIEWSEAQERHRLKFQEAVLYAKSALANAELKKAYQASTDKNKSAYNVAVADFLNAPHINEVDVAHYTGQPDDFIQVRAVDDFEVKEVTVTIQNADGTEVESGPAVLQEGSIWWRYTSTVINESLEGDKITIRVSDVSGNLTEQERDI